MCVCTHTGTCYVYSLVCVVCVYAQLPLHGFHFYMHLPVLCVLGVANVMYGIPLYSSVMTTTGTSSGPP